MSWDDTLAGFNAEQRAYADDQRRALNIEPTLTCRDCGRQVPYSQMAVQGCECEADDLAEGLEVA